MSDNPDLNALSGTPPQLGQPASQFDQNMNVFVAALSGFQTQVNSVVTWINSKITAINTSVQTASDKAQEATTSASSAATSAANAAISANASAWAAGRGAVYVSIVTFVAGYGLESQQQAAMLALPVLSSELRNLGIDSFRPRYPRMQSGLGGFC